MTGLFQRTSGAKLAAQDLYRGIVAQAREPDFYRCLGIPDSLDGRFELIVLHVSLVVTRLHRDGSSGDRLAQALFDQFFKDMDVNLREMGVGDMGVPRRIKAMAQAFYGRLRAYGDSGAASGGELEEALRRNLLGTVEPQPWQVDALASYVRQVAAELASCESEALARGQLMFPAPPATSAAG